MMRNIFLKSMSCFIALILMIGTAYAVDDVQGADVKITERMTKSMVFMSNLGVFDSHSVSKAVTRGELAVVLMRLDNAKDFSGAPIAADINKDSKYFNAVSYVVHNKYMSLSENGRFYADREISLNELSLALVRFLGYGAVAEQNGGYPIGYNAQAYSVGLFKGITVDSENGITFGQLAVSAHNAVFSYPMKLVSVGEHERYAVGNHTVLTENFGLEKKKGIVTGVGSYGLYNNVKLNNRQIMIDRQLFKIDYADSLWLGANVIYYLDIRNDEYEILFLEVDEASFKKISVNADDIIDGSTAANFRYFSEDKSRIQKISENAIVLYNYEYLCPVYSLNDDVFNMESGIVEFIDNNNDDIADIVMIVSYEEYVFDYYLASRDIIVAKFDKGEINTDPDLYDVRVLFQGYELKLDELIEWDVLSVARGVSGKAVTIQVGPESVRKTVETVSDDEIECEGTVYSLSPTLAEIPKAGSIYDLCFRFDGKVAAIKLVGATTLSYGYLIKAAVDEKGLSKKAHFKIFTFNNEVKTYEGTDKILFKNSRLSGEEVVNDDLVKDKSQLIMYRTCLEDEVVKLCELKTAIDNTASNLPNEDEFTLDYSTPNDGIRRYGSQIGKRFYMSSSTIFLRVPQDKNLEKAYSVIKHSAIGHDQGFTAPKIYDAKMDGKFSVMVTESSMSVNLSESAVFVGKITTAIDDDGMIMKKIYGFKGNSEVTYYYDSDDDLKSASLTAWGYADTPFDAISPGDVMLASVNETGYIKGFTLLYSRTVPSANFESFNTLRELSAETIVTSKTHNSTLFGPLGRVVYYKDGMQNVIINTEGDGKNHTHDHSIILKNIFVFDCEKKEARVGSGADLIKGSLVFVQNRYDYIISNIYVYENAD